MKKLKWYHYALLALWLGGLIWLEVKIYIQPLFRPWLMIGVGLAFLVMLAIGVELFRSPTIDDKNYDI